jgi:hypothetical protein
MDRLRELYLYCRHHGIPVDPAVAVVAIREVGDYSGTRAEYVSTITMAMIEYMRGYKGMVVSRNTFKRAMVNSFSDAFETGYVETAGGDTYEPEQEDNNYVGAKMEAEMGYIDALFVSLKEIMAGASIEEPVTDEDIVSEADSRAEMYARTLDGVYSQGKLRGKKNIMLSLEGEDGKESCATCQKYKGVRHRAKWWVSHDLVPGPGNANYECNGYNCMHELQDDDGVMWAGNTQMVHRGGPGSGRYPAGSGGMTVYHGTQKGVKKIRRKANGNII